MHYTSKIQFMKNFSFISALLVLPWVSLAQGDFLTDGSGGTFGQLLIDILSFINIYLIPFIIGIGFLVFVWGMFQYFIYGGANDEAKEKGRSLMVYATLGFVLIIIFWGVVNLLAASTGFTTGTNATPVGVIPNDVGIGTGGGSGSAITPANVGVTGTN